MVKYGDGEMFFMPGGFFVSLSWEQKVQRRQ